MEGRLCLLPPVQYSNFGCNMWGLGCRTKSARVPFLHAGGDFARFAMAIPHRATHRYPVQRLLGTQLQRYICSGHRRSFDMYAPDV